MESGRDRCTVTKSLCGNSFDKQIVDAIAEATGREPLEVPPLYGSVDLDALKSLVVDRDDAIDVEFEHAGCLVTVDEGTVIVEPE